MKIRSLIPFLSDCMLVACGCCRMARSIPANATRDEKTFPDPKPALEFCPLDLGYALIFDQDKESVFFFRPKFRPQQQTQTEQVTLSQLNTVTREYVDASDQTLTKVEEVEIPEIRNRKFAHTIYEYIGEQVLQCPITSLSAFNMEGKRLTSKKIRTDLGRVRCVVIQKPGCTNDKFYGTFLKQDTLFLQSNDWIERELKDPNGAPEVAS